MGSKWGSSKLRGWVLLVADAIVDRFAYLRVSCSWNSRTRLVVSSISVGVHNKQSISLCANMSSISFQPLESFNLPPPLLIIRWTSLMRPRNGCRRTGLEGRMRFRVRSAFSYHRQLDSFPELAWILTVQVACTPRCSTSLKVNDITLNCWIDTCCIRQLSTEHENLPAYNWIPDPEPHPTGGKSKL